MVAGLILADPIRMPVELTWVLAARAEGIWGRGVAELTWVLGQVERSSANSATCHLLVERHTMASRGDRVCRRRRECCLVPSRIDPEAVGHRGAAGKCGDFSHVRKERLGLGMLASERRRSIGPRKSSLGAERGWRWRWDSKRPVPRCSQDELPAKTA